MAPVSGAASRFPRSDWLGNRYRSRLIGRKPALVAFKPDLAPSRGLMSGSAATADGDGAAPAAEPRGDTIARRTRTQLSLVDVPIDALEELLPEAAEPVSAPLSRQKPGRR